MHNVHLCIEPWGIKGYAPDESNGKCPPLRMPLIKIKIQKSFFAPDEKSSHGGQKRGRR